MIIEIFIVIFIIIGLLVFGSEIRKKALRSQCSDKIEEEFEDVKGFIETEVEPERPDEEVWNDIVLADNLKRLYEEIGTEDLPKDLINLVTFTFNCDRPHKSKTLLYCIHGLLYEIAYDEQGNIDNAMSLEPCYSANMNWISGNGTNTLIDTTMGADPCTIYHW